MGLVVQLFSKVLELGFRDLASGILKSQHSSAFV